MILLTRFELVMSILGGLVIAVGALSTVLRWVYRRGSSNRALSDSVARNTEATDKLTGAVDTLSVAVSDRIMKVEETNAAVADRVSRLEYDRIRFHGKD